MNEPTYFESAQGITIGYKRMLIEMARHQVCKEDWEITKAEIEKYAKISEGVYDAQKVLECLGY